MPRLTMSEDDVRELPAGEPVGSILPGDAVAARVDGRLVDLSFVPDEDTSISPTRLSDEDGLHVLRHSTAHVMAQAVCDLYPGAKYAIGPAIDDGFYYDFELADTLSPDDLPKIEKRMKEIA